MEDYIDLSSTGVDRGVFAREERSSIARAKQIKGSKEIRSNFAGDSPIPETNDRRRRHDFDRRT
jgi:hypothetical protein